MMEMKTSLRRKRIPGIFILIFFYLFNNLSGQSEYYYYFYRVYFRDKGENYIGNYLPEDLLSLRALNRRANAGIEVPDFRDIPVFRGYLNQITSLGYKLHCTSKWMNTALFKTQVPADLNELLNLPFVSDVKIVKKPAGKSLFQDKLDFPMYQADDPPYDRPVTMVNGYPLHNSGFDGKGILIAVLDGGFFNADQISSLNILRNRYGIKRTYDFVKNNEFVFGYHNHGTAVLSVLAGKINGIIEGTAPGADFMLFRTEDVDSEFPVEEDFWVSGAEYADSAGVDIISSSLGYFVFDDPALNYKYSDLDGNSTFISRAADIAASKGILVVNSAGNERNKEWIRIIAPSDGDSVVAVGAVDGNNFISSFSSAGPSSDGDIKPDNVAMGVSVTVQTDAVSVGRSSGTSFSCPVLSGMAACLMQAVPGVTNTEIIDALHYSSDRFLSPDTLYGYGIPDMIKALTKLQNLHVNIPDKEYVAQPNPTTGDVEITFRQNPVYLLIEIFSLSGETIFRQEYEEFAGRVIRLTALNNKEQGIYFVRLRTENNTCLHKVIKLNR
jgi:serine protease AprX